MTRRKLLADEPVFGAWVQSMSPRVAEVMAQTGLDWVGIDMEHTTIGARGTDRLPVARLFPPSSIPRALRKDPR